MATPVQERRLELESVIGYGGDIPQGLQYHPDGDHILYPLGSTIVIRQLSTKQQSFLQGHNDSITCLTVSKSGRYIASGQKTHMGFKADIIIWDFENRCIMHRLMLHMVKIQALDFSFNERFLCSIGGRDDANIVVWDVETGKAICGSPASQDECLTVKWFNTTDTKLASGGKYNLRTWQFDLPNRKLRPTDANLGQLQRVYNYIVVDDDDEYMYVGTETGEMLKLSTKVKIAVMKLSGPSGKKLSLGVRSFCKVANGHFLVGSGEGTILLMREDNLKVVAVSKLAGGVLSITANDRGDVVYAGTNLANMYRIYIEGTSIVSELLNSCHNTGIQDIQFPENYSDLFATCAGSDIRIWNTNTRAELLRIQVPNLDCLCFTFSKDGKSIISGWSDGRIRAFGPQSGKLLYVINDAHAGGVTAVCGSYSCQRVISGGKDGSVRIWRIGRQSQVMEASMKEHKGSVNALDIRKNDTECLSACSDGSCVIWDLTRFRRNNSLLASTFFQDIQYHPDESQILTTGTDRKITYWDAYDAEAIRIMEGSDSGEVNALSISSDGEMFVSGGADKLVKLWHYDEGVCHYYGVGHSAPISRIKISPNMRHIVSVGEEGSILIWKYQSVQA